MQDRTHSLANAQPSLQDAKHVNPSNHHKTLHTAILNHSLIEFWGILMSSSVPCIMKLSFPTHFPMYLQTASAAVRRQPKSRPLGAV